MAKREDLRMSRTNTIINVSSKKMENVLIKALINVVENLQKSKPYLFSHEKTVYLTEIVKKLRKIYPNIDFTNHFHNTYLQPDGGILYLVDKLGNKWPILISEAKRQGTNDIREEEGLGKQSRGNAIERLGKNLIGFRMWLSAEEIFPFVAFGEGIDFDSESSILDRVSTMAMFAPLNRLELEVEQGIKNLNRGSFFFRVAPWKLAEVEKICYEIASQSIDYYLNKYGKDNF